MEIPGVKLVNNAAIRRIQLNRLLLRGPVPGEGPLVPLQSFWGDITVILVESKATSINEALGTRIANIVFARLQICPIGSCFYARRVDWSQLRVKSIASGSP
jgi:hypothetical protein